MRVRVRIRVRVSIMVSSNANSIIIMLKMYVMLMISPNCLSDDAKNKETFQQFIYVVYSSLSNVNDDDVKTIS